MIPEHIQETLDVLRRCVCYNDVAAELRISRKAVEERIRKLRVLGYNDWLPEYVLGRFNCECCEMTQRMRHAPSGFCWACYVRTLREENF